MTGDSILAQPLSDADTRRLARGALGSANPADHARLLERIAAEYLDSPAVRALFAEYSLGAVFGVRLSDGRDVVLKIYRAERSAAYLRAMQSVQGHVHSVGYPAPRPLSPVFRIGRRYASFQEYVAGNAANGHDTSVRTQLAHALADLVRVTDSLAQPVFNPRPRRHPRHVWPTPHQRFFNLRGSTRGAGWLVPRIQRARRILNQATERPVLGHDDWSVRNTRFRRGRLVAVFDWDSLQNMDEAVLVGKAATTFTATWYIKCRVTPTPNEARAFVAAYEARRGHRFSRYDRTRIGAAADFAAAYTARLEHSLGKPKTEGYQALLAQAGEEPWLHW